MKSGMLIWQIPYILRTDGGSNGSALSDFLCKEQGAGLLCMEMISAKALQYKNKNTKALLAIHPDEYPVFIAAFWIGSEDYERDGKDV